MTQRSPRNWQLLTAMVAGGLLSLASLFWFDGQSSLLSLFAALPGDARELLENLAIFGHGTGVLLAFVLVLVLDRLDWRLTIQTILSPVIAGVLATVVKVSIQRPRPIALALQKLKPDSFGDALLTNSYQSFPSGHTATAVALALVLGCLYPRGRLFFYSLAAITAIERVMTRAHFPSDVLAGASIGILAFLISKRLASGRPHPELLANPVPIPACTFR